MSTPQDRYFARPIGEQRWNVYDRTTRADVSEHKGADAEAEAKRRARELNPAADLPTAPSADQNPVGAAPSRHRADSTSG